MKNSRIILIEGQEGIKRLDKVTEAPDEVLAALKSLAPSNNELDPESAEKFYLQAKKGVRNTFTLPFKKEKLWMDKAFVGFNCTRSQHAIFTEVLEMDGSITDRESRQVHYSFNAVDKDGNEYSIRSFGGNDGTFVSLAVDKEKGEIIITNQDPKKPLLTKETILKVIR